MTGRDDTTRLARIIKRQIETAQRTTDTLSVSEIERLIAEEVELARIAEQARLT